MAAWDTPPGALLSSLPAVAAAATDHRGHLQVPVPARGWRTHCPASC